MSFATCDICDANEDKIADGTLKVLPPVFQKFGGRTAFCGPAKTLRVFEDNVLVRSALETAGDGRVLVVDGGGSLRCALVGGNLAILAEKNGWAGLIIYGCVRDVDEINSCNVGVRALATHPQRSIRRGTGDSDLPVCIAGTVVRPADWIYADADGVLVSGHQLD